MTADEIAGCAWTCRWLSRCVGGKPASDMRSICARHSRAMSHSSRSPRGSPRDQHRQRVELAGTASCKRRRDRERTPDSEIQVKAEGKGGARPRTVESVREGRQIDDHRCGGNHLRYCRLDYSDVYTARDSEVVRVDDEPCRTRRRSHAHHFGGRGPDPSASGPHAWRTK